MHNQDYAVELRQVSSSVGFSGNIDHSAAGETTSFCQIFLMIFLSAIEYL